MAQFQTRPLASHFNLFMRRVFVFFGNLLAPLDFIWRGKSFLENIHRVILSIFIRPERCKPRFPGTGTRGLLAILCVNSTLDAAAFITQPASHRRNANFLFSAI
jgi:hypothetical protein